MTTSTPALTGQTIVRFEAENFKRLKAVEITPDGNIVEIRGRNAQGKTSVLDAIWHALSYSAAKKGTTKPIRDGETSAHVTLEFEDFVVVRTWASNDKPPTLKVTSKDGLSYSSPQALLDGLIGSLSFDPLTFANAADKDRLRMLLDVVDLPFDPDELAEQRKALFDRRTDVNRRHKELVAQVSGATRPPVGTPDAEVSMDSLLQEYSAAQETNRRHDSASMAIADARSTIARLEAELKEAESKLATWEQRRSTLDPKVDLEHYQARLAGLDATNAAVRAGRALADLEAQRDTYEGESDDLTASIEKLDADKASAIAEAALPVDGLGFDDDGVTYNGIPFSQSSGAEQLRVSLAMAMALNPGVRVIRITDASLLDSVSRALVEDMAVENDFQVWMEVVSEDGSVGVLIEDGEVVA